MKKVSIAIMLLVALTGCKDATQAQFNALNKPHIVKQFSGGQLIGQWESTGSVSNETQSDGWYFEDAATRKLVEVSGTLQIYVKIRRNI